MHMLNVVCVNESCDPAASSDLSRGEGGVGLLLHMLKCFYV